MRCGRSYPPRVLASWRVWSAPGRARKANANEGLAPKPAGSPPSCLMRSPSASARSSPSCSSGRESQTRSPWMTVAEVAEYLRWPRERVYKLTAAGAIPHRKHGGRLLFHRKEIDDWLVGLPGRPRAAPPPPERSTSRLSDPRACSHPFPRFRSSCKKGSLTTSACSVSKRSGRIRPTQTAGRRANAPGPATEARFRCKSK